MWRWRVSEPGNDGSTLSGVLRHDGVAAILRFGLVPPQRLGDVFWTPPAKTRRSNKPVAENVAVGRERRPLLRSGDISRSTRPDARIMVTGCAAQTEPETFAAMPEVDAVIGNPPYVRFQGVSKTYDGGSHAAVNRRSAAYAGSLPGLGAVSTAFGSCWNRSAVCTSSACCWPAR